MSVIAFHEFKESGNGRILEQTITSLLNRVEVSHHEVNFMSASASEKVTEPILLAWYGHVQQPTHKWPNR